MISFFEKLKKGMGVEAPEEELEKVGEVEEIKEIEGVEEKPQKDIPPKFGGGTTGQAKPATRKKRAQKLKVETKLAEPKVKEGEEDKSSSSPFAAARVIEEPTAEEEKIAESKIESKKEKWFEPEGQLAVDVYQTDKDLVIQSAIAGVKAEDLDISIEADTVLIKGNRKQSPEEGERSYFYQECYWGPFSRQIILPEETDPSRAQALMKEGVLTIRIPKIERAKKRKIVVAD